MTTLTESASASPWKGRYGRTTVGVFVLAFLFAFEAFAVTTVMPRVAEDLDGLRWYAVAFAGPLAASVVALSTTGSTTDRLGPGPALRRGLALFCLGVVMAGAAPSMPFFLLGRLVHGYGGGMIGVALYVVIAQAYPEEMRPRVFAALTTAWVLPALIGPLAAAQLADAVGWRWVFLGVPFLAVPAWLLMADALSRTGEAAAEARRLPYALIAAMGCLAISLAGQQVVRWWPLLVVVGIAAVVLGGRLLLPAGTWSLRPGLPAILGSRAAIGTAMAATEAYLPLLLTLERRLSLTEAGWVLTVGALTWSAGAVLAARLNVLSDQPRRVRLGGLLVGCGIAGFATVAVPDIPLWLPIVCWGAAGLGIGMAFSTLSVLALNWSPPREEGRTSSALQLNDQLTMGAGLALGGVVFAAFAATAPVAAATGLVLAGAAVGLASLVPASRITLRP